MERDAVLAKHAPQMVDLADAALRAVRALMAADRAANAEVACAREWEPLFGDEECSLEDAERALVRLRANAIYAAQDAGAEVYDPADRVAVASLF